MNSTKTVTAGHACVVNKYKYNKTVVSHGNLQLPVSSTHRCLWLRKNLQN